jgi:adenine-specific DNA-methyltransferase
VECLKPGGQLIFICPSYWFSTTHAKSLRNYLVENGSFREIYLFKETPIFPQVASSLTIFKYVKNSSDNQIKVTVYDDRSLTTDALAGIKNKNPLSKVTYINIDQFKKDERWVIADRETQTNLRNFSKNSMPLGLVAKIGNGLVTGLDAAFQIPKNKTLTDYEKTKTIKIVKGKELEQFICKQTIDYIFAQDMKNDDEFGELCPNFKSLLVPYMDELKKRYCYGRDIHYWHWVFLRNYDNLFKIHKPRIFVPGKERVSHKNYFRFAYAP